MQHRLNLTTVICEKCAFVFTNPLPDRETYERFYAEAYADYYGKIAARPGGRAREQEPRHIRRRLDQIEQVQTLAGSRLLEVGPGQGLLLWWARQRGSSVFGVEPSPDFCKVLAAEGLPHVNAALEQVLPTADRLFDVLVMSHVLEHMYDPNAALGHCRSLLKQNGMLAVEVPNILKPFRSLDHYFLRYVHPSNFSPETLRATLEKHGFVVQFVDQGGTDWREPQNLFVIARRLDSASRGFMFPSQTVDEVTRQLQRYRLRWSCGIGAASWVYHHSSPGLRLAFRVVRRLKRSVIGTTALERQAN